MAKFTVDRRTWARGSGGSRLLSREDSTRCCIGFGCSQLGVPDSLLLGKGVVRSLPQNTRPAEFQGLGKATEFEWVVEAYEANDDPTLSEDGREVKLKKLAASAGHEFEFVN